MSPSSNAKNSFSGEHSTEDDDATEVEEEGSGCEVEDVDCGGVTEEWDGDAEEGGFEGRREEEEERKGGGGWVWVVEEWKEVEVEVEAEEVQEGTDATRNPKHLTADASILSLSCSNNREWEWEWEWMSSEKIDIKHWKKNVSMNNIL
jgi:hypothetical protein